MRTILYLIRKEFLQIFRNKFIGRAIFAVPIVQMLVLVPAVTFEIKEVRLCVIDRDMSPESRSLINQLEGSTFFRIVSSTYSEEQANSLLLNDKCSLTLQIPFNFGRDLNTGRPSKILASVNAINALNAQLSWAYLNGVLREFNADLVIKNLNTGIQLKTPLIDIRNRYWYNEMLNYKYYMLPGILGILVTAIGFLLAGLNLVREKEVGTIEQINVTPVKKYQFIIAKMVPFLIIGVVDLIVGLVLGRIAFHIPFEGSIALLFLCATIFLIAILGFALFISTFAGTQQQFMFVAFFFMLIFILMSGIFTPLESMPGWAQKIDLLNPVAYIMKINRMVMLKGSSIKDISTEIYSLIIIAVFFTVFAVKRYRKTA
jgi:ABC-2 type transport system permease protein